jgi:hypothetical protein
MEQLGIMGFHLLELYAILLVGKEKYLARSRLKGTEFTPTVDQLSRLYKVD